MKKIFATLLCISETLCLGIGMTACGGNDDKKDEIPLTAETDFTALVSEKVDEDGWKKALMLNGYDVNFSDNMTVIGKYKDEKYKDESYIVKYNINELFYKGALKEDGETFVFEASIKKDKDETISYYYYDNNESEGFIQKTPKKEDNTEDYEEMDELYKFYHLMYCPDFSDQFNKFTYDETKHSYVCANKVEGTAIFETFNEDGSPMKEDYTNVEIKIVNGRLAYLACESVNPDIKYNEYYIVSKFYDFGKTSITYKDVEEITEMPE